MDIGAGTNGIIVWHLNFTLKHKDTLNIHSSILSRLRIHKHTFTTEATFSLAYTITLTSSPLSHISLQPYIHRRKKCIDTKNQRLKIIFKAVFWLAQCDIVGHMLPALLTPVVGAVVWPCAAALKADINSSSLIHGASRSARSGLPAGVGEVRAISFCPKICVDGAPNDVRIGWNGQPEEEGKGE